MTLRHVSRLDCSGTAASTATLSSLLARDPQPHISIKERMLTRSAKGLCLLVVGQVYKRLRLDARHHDLRITLDMVRYPKCTSKSVTLERGASFGTQRGDLFDTNHLESKTN